MTQGRKKERTDLDRLSDALAEEVFALSDEEILAAFREMHGDPDQHAQEMRAALEQALITRNKGRLAIAKAGVASLQRGKRTVARFNPTTARQRLRELAKSLPTSHNITMAARKENELSDADVIDMVEDYEELVSRTSKEEEKE